MTISQKIAFPPFLSHHETSDDEEFKPLSMASWVFMLVMSFLLQVRHQLHGILQRSPASSAPAHIGIILHPHFISKRVCNAWWLVNPQGPCHDQTSGEGQDNELIQCEKHAHGSLYDHSYDHKPLRQHEDWRCCLAPKLDGTALPDGNNKGLSSI